MNEDGKTSADQNGSEEQPLLTHGPLIDLPEVKPRRKPYHWALFAVTCFLSFAPLVGGLLFGVTAIVGAVNSDGLFPWWAGVFGLGLIVFCLSGPIMNIYGITEVDNTALWASLAFAILSWPGVAVAIFILTYVAPEEPMQAELCTSDTVEDPASENCIWD